MEINAMKTGDPIKLAVYEKMSKTGRTNQNKQLKTPGAGHQRAKSEAVLAPVKLKDKEEIAQRYKCIQFLKRLMEEG